MARPGGMLLPLVIILLTVTAAAAADKPGKPPKAEASPPPPGNTPYTPPPSPPRAPQTPPPPPPQAPQTSPPPPPHAPATPSPTPGHSGEAPGHSGEAPGHSGETPGHSGEAPGHSGEAPGHASQPPPPPPGHASETPPPTPKMSPPPPGQSPETPPPTPETPPPTPKTPPPTPETSPPTPETPPPTSATPPPTPETPPPTTETPPPTPETPPTTPETPPPTPETPPSTPETPPSTPETPPPTSETPPSTPENPPPTPDTPPPTPETPPSTPETPPSTPETPPPPTPEIPPPTPETPPSTPETSPPPPKPMKVQCRAPRRFYPNCRSKWMECPSDCSQSCFADCNLCKPVCVCSVPGACGDPRFIGGDGNTFYFHGRKDADFCVLSDRDLHINAHFIGKRGADMSRDFTWIQAIGVLYDGHSLYVGAKKTAKWDDDVDRLELTLDGEPVHIPKDQTDSTWMSRRVPTLSVTRTKAANGVLVVLSGRFSIRVNAVPITEEDSRVHHYGKTAEDSLAHLELAFKFDALTDDVHGVVGQTYRSDYVNRFDVKEAMPTMGGKDSFSTSSLFAPDCAVSRFGTSRGNVGATVMSELAGVSCASGLDGQGVVCKK